VAVEDEGGGRRSSSRQWDKLMNKVPSFADLLLAVPALEPDDLPKRRAARIMREGSRE
jgi:hypothetical protein